MPEKAEAPWADQPGFALPLPPEGYAWWYLDGLSDDGETGLVLIALLGNPFSPFLARARKRVRRAAARADRDPEGPALEPLRHAAMNAVLYRGRRKLWTFTERSLLEAPRPGELAIGPSHWRWERGALVVRFDERSPVLGWRLRGRVRLEPTCCGPPAVALDAAGLHRWRPLAPRALIEVELEEPRLRLRGRAYHDMNTGEAPLDEGFRSWQWFHASLRRATLVHYDVVDPDGSIREGGWRFTEEGEVLPAVAGSSRGLGLTRWCMPRSVRLLPGEWLRRSRTLESSPFYARTLLRGELDGEPATVLHESLNLARFRRAAVRALFYLRMRRAVPWTATPPLGLLARLRGWS